MLKSCFLIKWLDSNICLWMLITSGKIRISTNLPISLCRHLRISLYLQPLVNKNKTKKSKNKKKSEKNQNSIYDAVNTVDKLFHLVVHIFQETAGTLLWIAATLKPMKTNISRVIFVCPCQQEHVDIHTAFKLIKTYQEMCSGVSSSSPTSSSDEESNSLVLISSAPP